MPLGLRAVLVEACNSLKISAIEVCSSRITDPLSSKRLMKRMILVYLHNSAIISEVVSGFSGKGLLSVAPYLSAMCSIMPLLSLVAVKNFLLETNIPGFTTALACAVSIRCLRIAITYREKRRELLFVAGCGA